MIKILSLNFELSCVSQRMFVASLSGSILARVALSMRQEKSGFFPFFYISSWCVSLGLFNHRNSRRCVCYYFPVFVEDGGVYI